MNTHRTIRTFALAAAFTASLCPAAFAAEMDGQLPSSVPSQEMIHIQQDGSIPPSNTVAAPQPEMAAPQAYAQPVQPMAHSASQARLSQAPNSPLQAKQEGDVTYISGGIGDGEVDQLKAESNNYNFHMINSDPTGHYTADTNLVITSRDGREVVRVDNAGPLFYAQLPPGEYKVEASNGSQHETRAIRVSTKGHSEVHLVWR